MQLGEIAKAKPGVAIGSYPFFDQQHGPNTNLLVAPKWSAYVSKHEVRHFWSCENCGHKIEMRVNPRINAASNLSQGGEWSLVG
jgi:hypothetical protein